MLRSLVCILVQSVSCPCVNAALCITTSRDLTNFWLRYTLQTSTFIATWHEVHTTNSTTIFKSLHKKFNYTRNTYSYFNCKFLKTCKNSTFIHNLHQQKSYYRQYNHVNNSLWLINGVKFGILHSLKMAHFWQNMSEICL